MLFYLQNSVLSFLLPGVIKPYTRTISFIIPPRWTVSASSAISVVPALLFGKSATGFVWNTVFNGLVGMLLMRLVYNIFY